jgi:hypothetical protein
MVIVCAGDVSSRQHAIDLQPVVLEVAPIAASRSGDATTMLARGGSMPIGSIR